MGLFVQAAAVAVGEETGQSGGVYGRARLNGGRRFASVGRCRPLLQARASTGVLSGWCRRGRCCPGGGRAGGRSRQGGSRQEGSRPGGGSRPGSLA
jgi:hypothetical protein